MKLLSIEKYLKKKNKLVADEPGWKLFRDACIFVMLGLTSLLMSVVNFFTHKGAFTWVTLGFAVLCGIDLLLLRKRGKAATVAIILFSTEVSVLFIYFIISGIPDGFSVLWTAMLPCFGLLMFGLRNGTLFSLFMFLILAFFFWIPFGQSLLQYRYSPTFMMRFPILYFAFFVVALLLERMRDAANQALKESREKYEYLCYHDVLTGLYNRFWLQSLLDHPEEYTIKPAAIAILDIDNFKYINDNFGHPNGDIVIRDIGQAILTTLNNSGDLCRWGGDEFLILFHTDIDAEKVCKRIVDAIRALQFVFDGEQLTTTVSVGLVTAENGGTSEINALIRQVDKNLYLAKDEGKDCTVSTALNA